ncbi:MAG: hypothetical protein HQK67_02410 [Desulfamplus sp.]|nr:hypothetical protein [Desulfamplus sp.]
MLKYAKNLCLKISIDHHSQGLLLVLAVLFIISKAWWSLAGIFFYGIMHFQYGGSGTFQVPARANQQLATIGDLLYCLAGIGGMILIIGGLIVRVIEIIR